MWYGKASDTALFTLATTGMREVKEFTKWNAGQIRKQLAGKPAPELEVTDIKGNQVSLSALKGKTVLLDFGLPGVRHVSPTRRCWMIFTAGTQTKI